MGNGARDGAAKWEAWWQKGDWRGVGRRVGRVGVGRGAPKVLTLQ